MDDGWIKKLKPGDRVIFSSPAGDTVKKVETATPKGFIRVYGVLFDKSGFQRGGNTWSRAMLLEPTVERLREICYRNLARRLAHTDWSKLPHDVLVEVWEKLRTRLPEKENSLDE